MTQPRAPSTLPHALDEAPAIERARAVAGHLFVGLDFDGTLAPIVPHPDQARLPDPVRVTLTRLAERQDTVVAVLSGRALADVRARVPVPGVCFSGNHGLEIEAGGRHEVHPAAAAARPAIQRIAAACAERLAGIEGVLVEDKDVTLSVHYRLVAEEEHERVRAIVAGIVRQEPGVRAGQGKMIVEVRPDVALDKGTALAFLRGELHEDPDAPALFIGDDRTDEDAFRELGPQGWGIIVAEHVPARTQARAWLRDPGEVAALLARLAADGAA